MRRVYLTALGLATFLNLSGIAAQTKCLKDFGEDYCALAKKSRELGRTARGVSLTWMGVAGVLVSDGETRIFIDPFLTRPSISQVMFRDPLKPDQKAIDQWLDSHGVKKADAVFVTHSHYDHALDAPLFAKATHAEFYGSQSTLNTVGDQLNKRNVHLIEAGKTLSVGQFKVTMRESEHGKIFLGRVPFPGKIAKPVPLPAAAQAYLMGEVYSVLIEHPKGTILHHASAGWKSDTFRGWKADLVLLGIAGRSSSADLYENVVKKVSAKKVYAIHFDNFFRSLADDLKLSWGVDLSEFIKTAHTYEPAIHLEGLPLGEPVLVLGD